MFFGKRKFLIFEIGFVAIFFLISPLRAAAYTENFDGADQLQGGEQCDSQELCPGMCRCHFEVDSATFGAKKVFDWAAYNPRGQDGGDPLVLWSFQDTAKGAGGANFIFNKDRCDIDLFWSSADAQFYANKYVTSKGCSFSPAFCCIKTDSQGVVSESKRRVDYDARKNFVPTCEGLGTGYKPVVETKDGCQALVGQATGTPATPAAAQTAGQSADKLKDLQTAASGLNKAKFGSIAEVIGRAIQILLSFIGSIAIVLYVYSGILWMIAGGNSEAVGKAKQIILWTTLGVAIMLSSYLIANFVFKSLGL